MFQSLPDGRDVDAPRRSGRRALAGRAFAPGFSLVELLVVIGIIAVLVGILLPVVGKARESANRSACLSNLRQVYMQTVLYASEWHDRIPIGCHDGDIPPNSTVFKGYNFVIRNGGQLRTMGLLFERDPGQDPRVYFCPSETNPKHQFDSPEAPWQLVVPPPGTPFVMHAGYGARPEVGWKFRVYEPFPKPMPRLTRLKGKAIFADLTYSPRALATRHRAGVQVIYADGSAKWVPRTTFPEAIDEIPLWSEGHYFYNAQQERIWSALDEH